MMLKLLTLVAVLVMAACEGPMGPAGPAGPQGATGPQGIQGPAGAVNRIDFTGVATATGISVPLPAASVAGGKLPFVGCYVSDSAAQTWLVVSHTPFGSTSTSSTYCGLTGIGTSTPSVTMVRLVAGDRYYIVVMW